GHDGRDALCDPVQGHALPKPSPSPTQGQRSRLDERLRKRASFRAPAGRSMAESATPAEHGAVLHAYVPALRPRSDALAARSDREADVQAVPSWPRSRSAAAVPCAIGARSGGSWPSTEFQSTYLKETI